MNGKIDYTEVIQNALIFIPYGIFISTLWDKKPFIVKVLPIILTSFLFETIQFVFAIGASDITDIIANSLGGVIGIAIAFAFLKIFKENWEKDYKWILPYRWYSLNFICSYSSVS